MDTPRRVAALIGSFADVWCLAGGKRHPGGCGPRRLDPPSELGLTAWGRPGGGEGANLEVLLSAQPDFILASSNTAADLELQGTFERAGIPVAYLMCRVLTTISGC